jgi:hypothetical protein
VSPSPDKSESGPARRGTGVRLPRSPRPPPGPVGLTQAESSPGGGGPAGARPGQIGDWTGTGAPGGGRGLRGRSCFNGGCFRLALRLADRAGSSTNPKLTEAAAAHMKSEFSLRQLQVASEAEAPSPGRRHTPRFPPGPPGPRATWMGTCPSRAATPAPATRTWPQCARGGSSVRPTGKFAACPRRLL